MLGTRAVTGRIPTVTGPLNQVTNFSISFPLPPRTKKEHHPLPSVDAARKTIISQLLQATGPKPDVQAEIEKYRRNVAIIFTDIKGSTAYFEKYGDAAGLMMVLGGAVRGGLHGTAASLAPGSSTLENNSGDVRYETDFRSVYAKLLDQWLGVNSVPILNGDFRAGAPAIF